MFPGFWGRLKILLASWARFAMIGKKGRIGGMKGLLTVLVICSVGGLVGSLLGWQEVRRLRAENESLRVEVAAGREKTAAAVSSLEAEHQKAIKKLEADASEVHKLRGEVGRLRSGEKALGQLQEANRKLVSDNQLLRQTAADAVLAEEAPELGAARSFPKENWEFLGYTTPEDGLISAIWSMQQGDPQVYFDSLAPEEQDRMAERWQDKTEDEVAEKHRSDVEAITGLQVLNRQNVSETEIVMDIYIEGPGRMESVSMQRVGEDWKFRGYLREEQP